MPLVLLPMGNPVAQDGGGLNARLTLGQKLQYDNETGDTNVNDEGFSSVTDLGLRLTSETRTQRFALTLGGALRYEINDNGLGDRFKLDNPAAGLSYSVENRSTRLSFDGSYRRSDIDEVVFDLDPLDPDDDVISGGGTRTERRFGTVLELGRDAPVGGELSYSLRDTSYSDATDPSLVDIETERFGAKLRFTINPQLTTTLFADVSRRDAARAGSNDRDSTRYGIGASYDVSARATATAELSFTEIDTDDNAGTQTSRDGIGYKLGLNYDMPNGAFTFDLREEETVNGKRRELSIGRGFEYRRGTANLSVGLSKTDGLDIEPVVNLNATYEIDPLSQLNIGLSQSSNVSDDNDATIQSRLSLNYARALSEISQLSAELVLIDRNAQGAGGQDQTSTRIKLSHRYGLGRDLDLVSGYRYSVTRRDGQADRKDTTIYLGLEKAFDFRP